MSVFITLAAVLPLPPAELTSCSPVYLINEWTLTFRVPAEDPDFFPAFAGPFFLQLAVSDYNLFLLHRTDYRDLGEVPATEAIGCGALISDTWSTAAAGCPAPTLCFWEEYGQRVSIGFQGSGTRFVAGEPL